jgi:hypothetical protein
MPATNHAPKGPQAAPRSGGKAILDAAAIGLGSWALAFFLAAPSMAMFTRATIFSLRSGDYVHQCQHPLTRALGTPLMAYRVFVPAVAHLLGANLWLDLLIPYAASAALLAVVAFVVGRRLGRPSAVAAAVLVGTSYAVTWPNNLLGYPDSVSHLIAASLVLVRRRWLFALLVLCGLLTDERFLLSLPFVALWLAPEPGEGTRNPFPWSAAAAGIALWLAARHALTAGWIGPGIAPVQTYLDMKVTVRNLVPTQMSWTVWWGNVAVSYRWAWIVIAAGAARRWRRGGRAEAAALLALLALSTASTIIVFDVARSVAFTFLCLPIALAWLAEAPSSPAPRVAVWAAWLCIATPSLWVVPGYSIWWRPLPLRIAAYVTGRDPIAWQSVLK